LNSFVRLFGHRKTRSLTPDEVKDEWFYYRARFDKNNKPYANDTIRLAGRAYLLFQKWMLKNGLIKKKQKVKLKLPPGRVRKRIPTQSETKTIIRNSKYDFQLVYRFLRASGCWPIELANMLIEDINEDFTLVPLFRSASGRSESTITEKKINSQMRAILKKAVGERTDGVVFCDPKESPGQEKK